MVEANYLKQQQQKNISCKSFRNAKTQKYITLNFWHQKFRDIVENCENMFSPHLFPNLLYSFLQILNILLAMSFYKKVHLFQIFTAQNSLIATRTVYFFLEPSFFRFAGCLSFSL